MTSLIAFLVTILIIVTLHEWGHYLAMRLFGVRVLTFSIGFGKPLFGFTNRRGERFVLSAIPLGGYVRALDRRETEVQPGEEQQEFMAKPAWQRVLIYAAGPLMNLILAALIFWALLITQGEAGRVPMLDTPPANTPAALAGVQGGDRILRLGEHEVATWSAVSNRLLHQVGERGSVALQVQRGEVVINLSLPLAAWAQDPEQDPFQVLGLLPEAPRAQLGEVVAGGAAEVAGLRVGDTITAVNGEPIDNWNALVAVIQANPDTRVRLTLERAGETLSVPLTPAAVQRDGQPIGQAGIRVAGVQITEYSALSAVPRALERVWDQSMMILSSIGKLFTGQLSVKTLGGPLTIATVAGETAAHGLLTFALFLAFFSISLGVLNLLPIPMLDGGGMVFGVAEMVLGRPLPEQFVNVAYRAGFVVVIGVMVMALYNDLLRHVLN